MKDYQEVVSERFDQEGEDQKSIYSADHPIGKYIRASLYKELDNYLEEYTNSHGPVENKTLLDIGCGNGGMIEFFIDRGFDPKNVTGVDLSNTRILKAKRQTPDVNFICDDAITFSLEEKNFDMITAFDLFSHFTKKEQIQEGLQNIKNHLDDNGVFVWYDIYSLDHFSPSNNADAWGFSKEQILSFAKEAGFEIEYYKPLFKLFFNKYQSIYQVQRLSPRMVKFLERILPGNPGNMMMVFVKKR